MIRLLSMAMVSGVLLLTAAPIHAGAPQPPDRAQALLNVCKSGTNRGLACDPTAPDCPGSTCEIQFVSKNIAATLTAIYDDFVLDWAASAVPPPAPIGGPGRSPSCSSSRWTA